MHIIHVTAGNKLIMTSGRLQVNQKRPELARMNQEAPPPEKPDRPTTEE
jgi:hypothetical protein